MTLQGFIDWKTDITNLFATSLSKFWGDPLKLITAQQYIDNKTKTFWRTYVQSRPQNNIWDPFLQWTKVMISCGANFIISTTQDHYQAHQQPGQSSMSFNIYFSVLESVIKSKTDSTLAIKFFIRFDPILQDRIVILGRDTFSTNH